MTPAQLGRTVLLVDSNATQLESLKEQLERKGLAVEGCDSCERAIVKIQEEGPAKYSAVATESGEMGMAGLELIEWLKSIDSALAVVMMAPAGERAILEAALRKGASDCVEVPASIEKLAEAVENACAKTVRARQLNEAEKNILAVAKMNHLFRSVLVPELTPYVKLHHTPRDQVGGDFVNVLPMGGGRQLLLVGDVSGHDLRAGFVSAYFQGLVRGLCHQGAGIVEICTQFNRILFDEWEHRNSKSPFRMEPRTSLSLLAMEIDPTANRAVMVNCGAPAIRITYTDGREEKMQELNMPLGWNRDEKIQAEELDLADVGYVFMATDGLHDWAKKLGNSSLGLAYRLIERAEKPDGTPPDDLMILRYQHARLAQNEELWHPLGRAVKTEENTLEDIAARLHGLLKMNLKTAPSVERILTVLKAEQKEVSLAGVAVRPHEGKVKMRIKFADGSEESVRVLGVDV